MSELVHYTHTCIQAANYLVHCRSGSLLNCIYILVYKRPMRILAIASK